MSGMSGDSGDYERFIPGMMIAEICLDVSWPEEKASKSLVTRAGTGQRLPNFLRKIGTAGQSSFRVRTLTLAKMLSHERHLLLFRADVLDEAS